MSAMEQMIAKMVGITPEEIKEMATRMQSGLIELATLMKRTADNSEIIIANQELILDKLGVERNGGRKQLGIDPNSGIAE